MQGSSMPDVADFNERLVLQAVRRAAHGVAQVDVAARTGLSRQAVSVITRRLLDRGLIETAGRRPLGRGKPQTLLRVRPRSRMAVGIHLDPWFITITIVDLLGQPLARVNLAPPSSDPLGDLGRIRAALDELALQVTEALCGRRVDSSGASSEPRSDATGSSGESLGGARAPHGVKTPLKQMERSLRTTLLGVGIATPGGLDASQGVVKNPPWLPGWRDVPVVTLLEDALAVPVYLGKDTSAALTGERWIRHLHSDETQLYIYVGSAVGSAVFSDGHVLRGSVGLAGEIGHFPTGMPGPVCRCGRFSCLGLFTDVEAMLSRAREVGYLPVGASQSPLDELTLLVQGADAGDHRAEVIVEDHGRALGEVLRTLLNVHDPDRVIIGGPSWSVLSNRLLPIIRTRALARVPDSDEDLVSSAVVGDDVGAIGAASFVLEKKMDPSSSVYRGV